MENWNKSRTIFVKLKTIQEPITITHLGDIYVDNNRVLRPELVERNEVNEEREIEVDRPQHPDSAEATLFNPTSNYTHTPKKNTHIHVQRMFFI